MGRATPILAPFASLLLTAACATRGAPGGAAGPAGAVAAVGTPEIAVTWLSITNWLVEAGDTRILLDGYLTRIDRRLVEADGTSHGPAVTDTAELRRLLVRAIPDLRLDWILVGHGHWDHAFDVPAIARMTGARIVGARTVCLQAMALGIEPERCVGVEGGEVLAIGPDVEARVVRWHHSGDPGTESGRLLSAPLELRTMPAVDPRTGGLRPGFLEDYPNGGGSRAYLLTVGEGTGPGATLFWSNSGNPAAWDEPLRADTALLRRAGVDLSNLVPAGFPRPTRGLLAAALREQGLTGVDAWIGFPGPAHVRQVVSVLRPRAFIPQHWDDFWTPMRHGVEPFDDAHIRPVLDSAGIVLLDPGTYFRRFSPLTVPEPGSYDAGVEAGMAAAAAEREPSRFLRFATAAGGGFVAGATFPFVPLGTALAAGGVGVVAAASESGATDPPLALAREAQRGGPDYAAGFAAGFADRRKTDRRRTAWGGGALGAAAGFLWMVLVVVPGT